MEDMENELKDLKEKNNALVQKVQYWKMTAAQRENEKLDLMKENNDLRLKLSRLRNSGTAHARKLDAALQSASEDALSHLVQASSAVVRTLELAKTYMQDRQELESALPRWSTLSNTPTSEKVNIVPPMLIGGRLIQPVVSLSRTLQANNSRSTNGTPNQQNRTVTHSALPMHMLQEVYIPLTRIDAGDFPINNAEEDEEINQDNSTEDLAMDDSGERIPEESQNIPEPDDYEERGLDVLIEDVEPEEEQTPQRASSENPLEGPSWLLDRPMSMEKSKCSTNFEPDSTTGLDESNQSVMPHGPSSSTTHVEHKIQTLRPQQVSVSLGCEFSPTVRTRKCTSPPPPSTPRVSASPHFSPLPRQNSSNSRILKVLVAKMRLDDVLADASPAKRSRSDTPPRLKKIKCAEKIDTPKTIRDISPSKRLMRFDAPSPNGSTDSNVIVLESNNERELCSPEMSHSRTVNRINSIDSYNNRPSHNNQPVLFNPVVSLPRTVNRINNIDSRINRPNNNNRDNLNNQPESFCSPIISLPRTITRTNSVNSCNSRSNPDYRNNESIQNNHDNHNNQSNQNNYDNHNNQSNQFESFSPTVSLPSKGSKSNNNNRQTNHNNNNGQSNLNKHDKHDDRPKSFSPVWSPNQIKRNNFNSRTNHNNRDNDNIESNHNNQQDPCSSKAQPETRHRSKSKKLSQERSQVSNHNRNQRNHDRNHSEERDSRTSRESDSESEAVSETRTRRPRKAVVYTEKPLNRKLRR